MTDHLIITLLAWAIEAIFGWPSWLYDRIRHPVVWIGTLISFLERRLNNENVSHGKRVWLGGFTSFVTILAVCTAAWLGASAIETPWISIAVQAIIASSLIASRSMYKHVHAVQTPLEAGNIEGARTAVSMIVGRDTQTLEARGVAGAALESLAENTSDGVTAPLFWSALLGLPGIAAYKAINTLDSMIGHRSARYLAFGAIAARIDDAANIVPARLTGALFALVGWRAQGWRAMAQDAGKHASPNAGWPEAAMAGALGIKLGGPRAYSSSAKDGAHPWLNETGRAAQVKDVERGLGLYMKAMALLAATLLLTLIGIAS